MRYINGQYIAPFFNSFTDEQIKKQYAENAKVLYSLRDKAIKKGKKINGYSIAQLDTLAKQYEAVSK